MVRAALFATVSRIPWDCLPPRGAEAVGLALASGWAVNGNLLAPGSHDAHPFGHAHAAPPQLLDREVRQRAVEAVQGGGPRLRAEEPIDQLAGAGFRQLGLDLPVPPVPQARVPQSPAIPQGPPAVNFRPIPVRISDLPVSQLR